MQFKSGSYAFRGSYATPSDLVCPVACNVGDLLVAQVCFDTSLGTGVSVSSVESNVTWSQELLIAHDGNSQRLYVYVGKVTSAFAANGSTLRVSGTIQPPSIGILAFAPSPGYSFASTPVQQTNYTTTGTSSWYTGTDSWTSGDVTTTGGNKFTLLGVLFTEAFNFTTSFAAGTGFTTAQIWDFTNGGTQAYLNNGLIYGTQQNAGTYAALFSQSTSGTPSYPTSIGVLAIEEVLLTSPIVVGEPQFLTAGGSVTVPLNAQACAVFFTGWGNSNAEPTSISLTGSSLSQRASIGSSVSSDGSSVGVWAGLVSSAGSQTLSVTWSTTPSEGPMYGVAFINGINTSDWFREAGVDSHGIDAVQSTKTIASSASDLVLGWDSAYHNPAAIPPNETGWTSLVSGTGTVEGARLRSLDAPGASTSTINGQHGDYEAVAIISIKPNASTLAALPPHARKFGPLADLIFHNPR